MADRGRGTEETPFPELLGAVAHALVEDLRRAGVFSIAEARDRLVRDRRVPAEYRDTRRVLTEYYPDPLDPDGASRKARSLLVHILGEQAYVDAIRNRGWIAIRSRRFPSFDYWLNLFSPDGFHVGRHGESDLIVAHICIQVVTHLGHGRANLPVEDEALAMYLLAAYQEDRLLVIGNPDRNWY